MRYFSRRGVKKEESRFLSGAASRRDISSSATFCPKVDPQKRSPTQSEANLFLGDEPRDGVKFLKVRKG